MVSFTTREIEFLDANELCRLATVYRDGRPHVVPVNYIFHDNHFFIAVDYKTQKLKNIMHDSRVALIIDSYRPRGAIMIEGKATLIEMGPNFQEAYRLFHDKFAWVRRDPWREGEAPFIEVTADKKVSWGL